MKLLITLLILLIPTFANAGNPVVEKMVATYSANQARFYQQYRGTSLQGNGTIVSIDADVLGTASIFSITISSNGSKIQCLTENQNMAAVLNRGQQVSFSGTVYDVLFGKLILQNCIAPYSSPVQQKQVQVEQTPKYRLPDWQKELEINLVEKSQDLDFLIRNVNSGPEREQFNKKQILKKKQEEFHEYLTKAISGSQKIVCTVEKIDREDGKIKCPSNSGKVVFELDTNAKIQSDNADNSLFKDDVIQVDVLLNRYELSTNNSYVIIFAKPSDRFKILNNGNKEIDLSKNKNCDLENKSGVFFIKEIGLHNAQFALSDCKGHLELFNVRAEPNESIEVAIVRKMIVVIRRSYSSDFEWQSRKLARSITKSARTEDTVELEKFLMEEFFGNYRYK